MEVALQYLKLDRSLSVFSESSCIPTKSSGRCQPVAEEKAIGLSNQATRSISAVLFARKAVQARCSASGWRGCSMRMTCC